MHKFLADNDAVDVLEFGELDFDDTRNYTGLYAWVHGTLLRLERTRLRWYADALKTLLSGFMLPDSLLKKAKDFSPDVLVTVAHGNLFWSARCISQRLGLPWLCVFHDWWPYLYDRFAPRFGFMKRITERRFVQAYKEVDTVVSHVPGMLNTLKEYHERDNVVWVPWFSAEEAPKKMQSNAGKPFELLCIGNLSAGFGIMLRRLLKVLEGHPEIKLRLLGEASDWPQDEMEEAVKSGSLEPGFASRSRAKEMYMRANAFLAPIGFEGEDDVFLKTSFPSKIATYSLYEKPIYYWAPKKSSMPQFIDSHKLSTYVSDPNPKSLVSLIEEEVGDQSIAELRREESRRIKNFYNAERSVAQFTSLLKSTATGFLTSTHL